MSTDATAGDVAACLQGMRNRAEGAAMPFSPALCIELSQADVPALLGALEAVLALHQPGRVLILGRLCRKHEAHRHFSITSTEVEGVRDCPDCEATILTSCTGCGGGLSFDHCPARKAISAALIGDRVAEPPAVHYGTDDGAGSTHRGSVASCTHPDCESVARADPVTAAVLTNAHILRRDV